MDIAWLVETLRSLMTRMTLDDACAFLSKQFPPSHVHQARLQVEGEIGRIRILRDPPGLVDPRLEGWYPGPQETDTFWPAYRRLLESKDWLPRAIQDLDRSSTRIVSLLHHPGLGAFMTRGLVVGYIQSGKTANYTAVVAKAADAGYRMFIILSGVTNKLRKQTQERLESELRDLNPQLWISLTDARNDFGSALNANANAFLTQYAAQKTLCVVKKNSFRLHRLHEWLKSAQDAVLRNCPVLVIDDESDQASPNTGASDAERTKISQSIMDILKSLPKAAYVGYTATPFANIFIDPSMSEDLYPRHFIVSLERPDDYFGPERIFGRERIRFDEVDEATDGLDVVRTIPSAEIPRLRPTGADRAQFRFSLSGVPSLRDALNYFWMATAARYARGHMNRHSTMLIHTTQYAEVQNLFRGPISEFQRSCAARLASRDGEYLAALRDLWGQEQGMVDPHDFGLEPVSFDDLLRFLPDVVGRSTVVVENYLALEEDRLHYGDEPGIYVAIGGNIFSRGLTLEGLVTSYFIRSANAYDTLLQMGRWFGYRPGYADLPRIWVSDELRSYFFELATVEQELRYDISRYEVEGITPLEFAPRIRTHPDLLITARLKMRNAVKCVVAYSEKHPQTILFKHHDRDWLLANLAATRSLLRGQSPDAEDGGPPDGAQRWVFRGIRSDVVVRFLNEYSIHERSWNLSPRMLIDYIRDENRANALNCWNVVVVSQQEAGRGTIDLGMPKRVNKINRTRVRAPSLDYANMKALMSRADALGDVTHTPARADEMDWDDILAHRKTVFPDTGLLLIYPIAADSKAKAGSQAREDLEAVEDMVGIGLVFPESKRPGAGRDYMTADLSGVDQEVPELEEQD